MKQRLAHVTLLVRDYDEAIAFFTMKLGFTLTEDTILDDHKRWVIMTPPGAMESRILLARAVGQTQEARVGNQAGDRVFLFLYTDGFWRDYKCYKSCGIEFVRGDPRKESYGTVAVFRDLYGNLWDLIQPA